MVMTADRFVHYKIGVKKHDEEHWELLVMMNALTECIRNKSPHLIDLDALTAKLIAHFDGEAKHMEEIGFPYRKAHIRDHNLMLAKLNRMVEDVTTRNPLMVTMYARQLEDLFVDHIEHFDRQYAEYQKGR